MAVPMFTLKGTLTDVSARPLQGIRVMVFTRPSMQFALDTDLNDYVVIRSSVTTTDKDGFFTLDLVTKPDLFYRCAPEHSAAFDPITFAAPAAGTVLDLSSVVPETPSPIPATDAEQLRAEFEEGLEGKADLDGAGVVPSDQLPAYLDEETLEETIDDRAAAQASTPGTPLYISINETFDGLLDGTLPETVEHGWNAAAARPATTGQVTWIGWVKPINMTSKDVWFMIQSPTQRLTSEIAWLSLYLANDQASHYADGVSMPTIYDSSGNAHNLTVNTGIAGAVSPVFETSSANFSGKPSMVFNSSPMLSNAIPTTAQPFSIFAIVRATAFPGSVVARSTFNLLYRRLNSTIGSWTFNAGGSQVSVDGADTNGPNSRPTYFNGIYNSPNSALYRAGVLKVSAQNIGAASLSTGPLLIGGMDATTMLTGEIVALGVYPGAFTTDHLAVLDAFADSEYALV